MIIVWGSSLYGKVDEVRGGLFHVATKFGHLYYLPLFPTASHVVLDKQGDTFRGVPIRMSAKSVLMAWLRAGLVVACIVSALGAVVSLSDSRDAAGSKIGAIILAALFAGALIATYRLRPMRYASYKRAHELAEQIGLSERGKILLDLAYDIISREEAEAALEGLAALEEDAVAAQAAEQSAST